MDIEAELFRLGATPWNEADTLADLREKAAHKFTIFNVDRETKKPCHADGSGAKEWNKQPHTYWDEHRIIEPDFGFGMLLGLQANDHTIISLDFDLCGAKGADGVRVPCPIAKMWFERYLMGIDSANGLVKSSTAGNFNVLLYMSKSILARYKMEGTKFKVGEVVQSDGENGTAAHATRKTHVL
jgi:hypothetical protein